MFKKNTKLSFYFVSFVLSLPDCLSFRLAYFTFVVKEFGLNNKVHKGNHKVSKRRFSTSASGGQNKKKGLITAPSFHKYFSYFLTSRSSFILLASSSPLRFLAIIVPVSSRRKLAGIEFTAYSFAAALLQY